MTIKKKDIEYFLKNADKKQINKFMKLYNNISTFYIQNGGSGLNHELPDEDFRFFNNFINTYLNFPASPKSTKLSNDIFDTGAGAAAPTDTSYAPSVGNSRQPPRSNINDRNKKRLRINNRVSKGIYLLDSIDLHVDLVQEVIMMIPEPENININNTRLLIENTGTFRKQGNCIYDHDKTAVIELQFNSIPKDLSRRNYPPHPENEWVSVDTQPTNKGTHEYIFKNNIYFNSDLIKYVAIHYMKNIYVHASKKHNTPGQSFYHITNTINMLSIINTGSILLDRSNLSSKLGHGINTNV